MMILRSSSASPFARKVRIAAAVLDLSKRIEVVPPDTSDPTDALRVQNPLGKIPTLVLADGRAIYDSRVILEYLDHLAGGGRIVPDRPRALRRADPRGARRRRHRRRHSQGLRDALARGRRPQRPLARPPDRQDRPRPRRARRPCSRTPAGSTSPPSGLPARSAISTCASPARGAPSGRSSRSGSTPSPPTCRRSRRRGIGRIKVAPKA